ncbi:hypothetical protein U9M48_040218 [Paspalum notatum var. saurae]|uniref:Uncharacterized protein n=1 Tax=Paspalum notatum var. saurae TaxID=547442 RepID=A0AAQ3UQ39_PASNO
MASRPLGLLCWRRLADLLADEVEADGEEGDALEEQEVEVQALLGQQAPRGGGEEQERERQLLLEDPAALGDAAHELGRRRARRVGVGLGEREDIGLGRGAAGLLGDDPLVGAPQLEQPGHHGVELGDGHGVLEEEVGDDEGERLGRRQDVEDGHEHRDVADDPDGQLRLRHEHGQRQDHAEEREGVEGQHQLPQQEEEHHQEYVPTNLDVVEEDELPAVKVCPDGDVHVLDGGALHPAARVLERLDAPHAGGAIEAEEVEVDAVDLLLDFEVEAQVDVLQPGQQVLVLVHEAPPRLDQPELRVPLHACTDVMWDGELEEVRVGLEVCVEDGDELVVLDVVAVHGGLEVACLVAGAREAVAVDDVDAALAPLGHLRLDQHLAHLVVRVVQHLDQQPLPRPVHLAHVRDGLSTDLLLVAHGHLDEHHGEVAVAVAVAVAVLDILRLLLPAPAGRLRDPWPDAPDLDPEAGEALDDAVHGLHHEEQDAEGGELLDGPCDVVDAEVEPGDVGGVQPALDLPALRHAEVVRQLAQVLRQVAQLLRQVLQLLLQLLQVPRQPLRWATVSKASMARESRRSARRKRSMARPRPEASASGSASASRLRRTRRFTAPRTPQKPAASQATHPTARCARSSSTHVNCFAFLPRALLSEGGMPGPSISTSE